MFAYAILAMRCGFYLWENAVKSERHNVVVSLALVLLLLASALNVLSTLDPVGVFRILPKELTNFAIGIPLPFEYGARTLIALVRF